MASRDRFHSPLPASLCFSVCLWLTGVVTLPVEARASEPAEPTASALLRQVRDQYASLSSFSMRIEHQDSSGLYPGRYTQELRWRRGGRFELRVLKRSKAEREAADFYANGRHVLWIQPDKSTRTDELVPRPNSSPGWEVSAGPIISWLQDTESSKFYFDPPKQLGIEWQFGPRREWRGHVVRELVARMGASGRDDGFSLFLDAERKLLLGGEFRMRENPPGWVHYADQKLNPPLPATLGDRPARLAEADRRAAAFKARQVNACTRQLQALHQALVAYRRDHGRYPPYLSDLRPKYLPDARLLHCPADHSSGSPGTEEGVADPKLPVSYVYDMSIGVPKFTPGWILAPTSDGGEWTRRRFTLAQRPTFGDRVPIVRCWHHSRRDLDRPPSSEWMFVLHLTFGGQVYRAPERWELAPGTTAVVLPKIERDLAAGPRTFGRRWIISSLSWYFYNLAPNDQWIPPQTRPTTLIPTLRSLAAKFDALAKRDPALADKGLRAAVASLDYAAGDTQQAIAAAEAAVARPGYHWCTVRMLADLYKATGQRAKVIPMLETVARDAKNRGMAEMLAGAYEEAGLTEKADATRRAADPGGQLVGKPAPEFTLKDASGKEVHLADLRGKVVFLNFWASW